MNYMLRRWEDFARFLDVRRVASIVRALKAKSVIGPSGAVRVMVGTKPVDFRKGLEGLRPWCARACRQIHSRELSMCSEPSERIGSS